MRKEPVALTRATIAAVSMMFASTACSVTETSKPVETQAPPPAERFGWDYPCDLPDFAAAPLCITNALGTKAVVMHFIQEMYVAEQYDRLDRGLKNLIESKRRTFAGESADEAIHDTFKQFAPEFSKYRADAWQTTAPSSYFAHYAEARAVYNAAWSIRGGSSASSVSEESWTMFYARLTHAERILNEAPQELKSLPIWHLMMMAVLSDNPQNRSRAEQVFEDAATRWPTHFEFYKYRLTRLTPQWGGSWQLVDASIRQWSKRVEKTEGRSLYARLYIDLIDRMNLTPDRTSIDWSTMRSSLEDLVRLYPEGRFRLHHAAYSCFARDKQAFVKAIESARSNRDEQSADGSPWLDGHSFDACMVWAGQCSMDSVCSLHQKGE